ncbi:odorant receptor 7a-like [Bactrocera tryoni]|uniref:odorant receptor 7a-like n=1 Tax=Bactrocera tryoni TaxID=59916 RepID=UPI001A9A0BCF|nr:odorant receptor 7a-like [Bactrocera tryoni]
MLDLLKGRDHRVYASQDALIYLFNTIRIAGLSPPRHYGLLIVVLSPFVFNIGWIRYRSILSVMEILNSVQAALNIIGMPFKSLTLALSLQRLQSVKPLLKELDACHSESKDVAKIRRCAITGNRIVFGYIISYMLYGTLTVVSAVLSGLAPLTLWIPYVDWHRSTWEYWLQLSFDGATLYFSLLHQVINDSYPAIYIYIIRTQVQLLARRVSRLGNVLDKSEDANYHELQQCIIIHQKILRLVRMVQPVISVTMFVQFCIAAAIMSTTMINISIFGDITTKITSLIYLFCVLLQIWPTCYNASYLQADCKKLSMAIFHSNWMTQGKRFNKLLIYFLQRSQTDMPLRALKMFPVDLATNVSIAKFSFSLYTFIQQMGLGAHLND